MVEGGSDDGSVVGVPPPRAGAEYGGGLLRADVLRHPSGLVVLRVAGEFDAPEADDLIADLRVWLDTGAEVLLDLSRISFVGSGGIAALLAANRTAADRKAGLRLFCGESRPVRRALQISGTLRAFDVVDAHPAADGDGRGALFVVPDQH